MDQKFSYYLKDIHCDSHTINHVDSLLAKYETFFPSKIEDIFFVYRKMGDSFARDWGEVYLFSKKFQAHIADCFNDTTSITIIPIINRIDYLDIIDKNDPDNPKSQSKFTVTYTVMGRDNMIEASGINCRFLKRIFETYLLPNLDCIED